MVKTLGISILFDKDDEGNYTNNALLRQDILKYFLKVLDAQKRYTFNFWDIAKWLVENNREIVEYYTGSDSHVPPSTRINDRRDRINQRLTEFQLLGIIQEIEKRPAKKGNAPVQYYKFSDFGQMTAFIFESEGSTEIGQGKSYNRLFEYFVKHWTYMQSSVDKFCLIYYTKLFEKKLFKKFVDHFTKALHDPNVYSPTDFFLRVIIPQADEKSYEMWNIFSDSLMEFKKQDETKYNLFLYNVKLKLERLQEMKCHALFTFERIRFLTCNNPEVVTLEGYCNLCKHYVSVACGLLDYLEKYLKKENTGIACTHCGKGNLNFEVIT